MLDHGKDTNRGWDRGVESRGSVWHGVILFAALGNQEGRNSVIGIALVQEANCLWIVVGSEEAIQHGKSATLWWYFASHSRLAYSVELFQAFA